MNIKLGTAPDSWGVWFANDAKQPPWQQFVDEVASLGYRWIESGPFGYMPTDPDVLRPELERRNLQVVAAAVEGHALGDADVWSELEEDLLQTAGLLAALGAPYVFLIDASYTDSRTGEVVGSRDLDARGWDQMIEHTHRAADFVRERFGMQMLFHPHAETHVETEAQIERFLQDTDPARVALCFDTGHHAYRGGDPVAFMRKHHARIPYLHLKSIDADVQRTVEAERIPFAKAVGMDMFCEPSRGAVDFLAFRDVLREVDYKGYAMVEQDMYPAPFDKPLPIARRTRDYLLSIGIGA
ncbi:MAG: sugar phosphate isomerase/epimerase [Chloroflexi bacterium]|nr:sugar phosphate isomerase/epimerase [Chloroflexota bacterium]